MYSSSVAVEAVAVVLTLLGMVAVAVELVQSVYLQTSQLKQDKPIMLVLDLEVLVDKVELVLVKQVMVVMVRLVCLDLTLPLVVEVETQRELVDKVILVDLVVE